MKMSAVILSKYMARLCAAIIALMPFHAFLTVWLASLVGSYTLLRLWKEMLLLVLFASAVVLIASQPKARALCRGERIIWLAFVYVLFLIGMGLVGLLVGTVSPKAYAYGVLLDGRYLVFFGVTWLVTQYSDLLVRAWKKLLLIPASIVVGFATMQYTLLPADFLRHFGYGPGTIAPSLTIDQKDAYQRIQSTLRGANPFGAYLVIILSSLGALILRTKRTWLGLAGFYVLAGLALVFTFSRSAWLGVLASTAWLIWMAVTSNKLRKALLIAGAAATVSFGVVGYMLRDNDNFQNIFFHTNEQSLSPESSNFGHANAVSKGVEDIIQEPWGRGTGSAGPASVYNSAQPRIAENYYIQIGQEAGIIGLGLFIAINVLVALRLWHRRDNSLAAVLLASFIGITVINMLMHAWADDTLAYIWWGLAGAAVALPVRHKKPNEVSE